jgi:hypothetical protein
MVRPSQLGSFAGALPSAMIPGTGRTGVSLSPHVDIID